MSDPKDSELGASDGCSSWNEQVNWSQEQDKLPGGSFPRQLSPRERAVLDRVIDEAVMPRLLLGMRMGLEMPVSSVTSEHIGELSEIVTKQDLAASVRYFEALREQGHSVEKLFQDLLAPTARRLGELWEEDINDFMDVTRGAGHLQHIISSYSDTFLNEARHPVSNRRLLLLPMPGEQHTLGISIVGEHFRRAGWHVWGGPGQSLKDILGLVSEQWFDVIGLSMSQCASPQSVAQDIVKIRKKSRNKHIIVQVGGQVFTQNPELVAAVGADATGVDARHAVLQIANKIGAQKQT